MADISDEKIDPTSATPSGRRLGFLDVIRGIAALAVFMQHLSEVSFPFFKHVIGRWVNLGVFGVVAFFLVSGFIIPASIEKYATLGHFWRGRVFRLFPMYLFVLAAVLVFARFGILDSSLHACRHMLWCVGANMTMLEEFFGVPSVVGVAWTLGLEMVFYILCSIVFWRGWLAHSFRLTGVAIGVVALSVAVGLIAHRSLPAGRIGLLATCFFGTLVYRVYRKQIAATTLWVLLPLAMALGASFWLRFAVYPEKESNGISFTFACVCISWGVAYALFMTLFVLRDRKFPHWLEWLGKVSYSFYLLADLVPSLLPRTQHPWVWIGESLTACLLLSAVTYRWIERPAMLLVNPKARHAVGVSS